MNKLLHFILINLLIIGIGCHRTIPGSDSNHDSIYQVSILDALMAGIYDGETSIEELKTHGDFGLGTFNALDGEMIVLGGEVYQIAADGVAQRIDDHIQTPFAVVTFFTADTIISIKESIDRHQLGNTIDRLLAGRNIPAAIKITGDFSVIRTRSVPRQSRPYPPLLDVLNNQPEFILENVTGTIAGFRLPVYMKNINAPNYHFHFITNNESAGGHLLDFTARNLSIEIDTKHHIAIQLPYDDDFRDVNLENDAGTYR
ncbi:acetolactate decarboxylase [bacterium]|nr:acetolactate decarboxylase [bacterium]